MAECGDNLGSPYLPTHTELSAAMDTLVDYLGEQVVDTGKGQQFDVSTFVFEGDEEEVSSRSKETPILAPPTVKRASGPEMSVFNVDRKISEIRYQVSLELGKCILDKLDRLPFDEVLSFKPKADQLCDEIDHYGVIDSSALRRSIKEYMDSAQVHLSSQISSTQLTLGERDDQMKNVEVELQASKSFQDKSSKSVEALHSSLQDFYSKAAEMRQALASLEEKIRESEQTISESEVAQAQRSKRIAELEKRHSDLKEAPIIGDEDRNIARRLGELLEAKRAELKNLRWFA